MNSYCRLALPLGLAVVSTLAAEVTGLNEHIAVSSTAARDYRRDLPGRDGLRPETYVFSPGRFFENGTREPAMERITFADLTKALAPNLARQRFYPTKDVAAADLVIVVHWGASSIYEDPQREFNIADLSAALPVYNNQVAELGYGDTATLSNITDGLEQAQENSARALVRNAALLGYARELRKAGAAGGFATARQITLRAELSEERYFIILMAYDYQSFKKDKQATLRWVTRLSVRTPGNNFTEALPVLGQAGSLVFGKQVPELVHLKANMREGRVSLGEAKYLGFADEPVEEKKPQ